MSDRKRIVVNTEDIDSSGQFVHHGRKTRKKKTPPPSPTPGNNNISPVGNNKTLKNKRPKISSSLMNNIRKTYLNSGSTNNTNSTNNNNSSGSEFLSSLDFIHQVVNNATPPLPPSIPTTTTTPLPPPSSNLVNCHRIMKPAFGCLKQGVLPTYNTLNQLKGAVAFTQNLVQNPTTSFVQQNPTTTSFVQQNPTTTSFVSQNPTTTSFVQQNPPTSFVQQNPTTTSFVQQNPTGIVQSLANYPPVEAHRKNGPKIIRRTYKVGRNSQKPIVSVLLHNDTIRKRVQNQKYSLNSLDLNQIKIELSRAGLLKRGSDAPENMLRKMYENMILIGGPIKNFNPDTVAYNILNHPEVYAN